MISKWFIGVSAKSKGYFKGWGYSYGNNSNVSPSFTKQTALAPCYDTKEDAGKALDKYKGVEENILKDAKANLIKLNRYKSNWSNMSFNDKVKALTEFDACVDYYDPQSWRNQGYINFAYNVPTTYNTEMKKGINSFTWKDKITENRNRKKQSEGRIEYIRDKLLIRKCEIEIKFMEKHKKSFKWNIRRDDETAHSYCCACGGAVPSVPQLCIGGSWSDTKICAICMAKLADEAQRQIEKVSDEILEHYEADRFIVAMD